MLGVEPDARMAAFARRGGVEVEVATFEAWDPAGRAFDAVVAAQAWHWVDPVAGAAKAARVLRPGGRLAVFWNAFEPPPDLVDAFAAVYRRVLPGSPVTPGRGPPPTGTWRCAPRRPTASGRRVRSANRSSGDSTGSRPYTRDEWLELVPTAGGHSQLPPAKLAELLAGIGAAIDARGRQLHDALRHDGGHRSAHRHPLTRLHALVRCQRHAPGQATTPDRSPPAARPRMPRPNAC